MNRDMYNKTCEKCAHVEMVPKSFYSRCGINAKSICYWHVTLSPFGSHVNVQENFYTSFAAPLECPYILEHTIDETQ